MKTPMTFLLLGCFGLVCTLSCNAKKSKSEAKAEHDFVIVPGKRLGPFMAKNAKENDLVQAFGAENVKAQTLYGGEGTEMPGYVVYADTPDQLEVAYDSTYAVGKPSLLRISGQGTRWKTTEGISIGTTLEELIRINGKAITFYGFGWDYGGTISSWNGGKISEMLNLVIGQKQGEMAPDGLLGDSEFRSDNPLVKPKDYVVVSMSVQL
jgi:hypothetical protein